MTDWFETALKVLVGMGGVGVALGLVSVAFRMAFGRTSVREPWWVKFAQKPHDPATDQQLSDLRQTVERLGGDVAELQERLDFAERMLAQQRDRAALPEGAADARRSR